MIGSTSCVLRARDLALDHSNASAMAKQGGRRREQVFGSENKNGRVGDASIQILSHRLDRSRRFGKIWRTPT